MSIKTFIGCMFSGKTSELISEYTRWTNIGRTAIMINYSKDDRYGNDNNVYNHNKIKVPCIKAEKLMEIDNDTLLKADIILINEGQFFEDIVQFCTTWCETFGKYIVVCGLDGNFKRHPFKNMSDLISISDEVFKLKAFCKICNDGTPAIFSKLMSREEKYISSENKSSNINAENDVIIGGAELYMPLCRKCYINK